MAKTISYLLAIACTSLLVWPVFAVAADADGDGVEDASDNCSAESNADQRDTNFDGFGNLCDADLDNDFIVNFSDLVIFKAGFFGVPGSANWDPDTDFDGDGATNFPDLRIMERMFFGPPGPSGELALETPRVRDVPPLSAILTAVAKFQENDPGASFTYFNGHVDSFATTPKTTIPPYAIPVLEALGLSVAPRANLLVGAPTFSDIPKPAVDLDGDFSTLLPTLPETPGELTTSFGDDDDNDPGQPPPEEERTRPAENPQQLVQWDRPSDALVELESQAATEILDRFLVANRTVFELIPNQVGGIVQMMDYNVGAYFRRAVYEQYYSENEKVLYGRTLVHFDNNWNVTGISRMLTTPDKVEMPSLVPDPVNRQAAIQIASGAFFLDECDLSEIRTISANQAVDVIRKLRVWDVVLISMDENCFWQTVLNANTGKILNVAELMDRGYTDAKINRWYYPGGDQFVANQIVSSNQYTRNDRRLEHDFFYVMNDHRCEGDPESSCATTPFADTWCDEAHGTFNGSSYIRATRRTARDWNNYYPGASSETFAETHAYYWARQFSQWLKSSLDANGVLPNSASNFTRTTIITDACRNGSVANSSYSVTTDDNKGEGGHIIRLAHRNPTGSSNHNKSCQGGGCFDNPSNLAHELNHFFLSGYYGFGSGLDCGGSNQMKFTHEGILGTAVPQAFWHYYYGIGYNPSSTDDLYFSHSAIGRVHTSNSNDNTIGGFLCVNNTDDPYSAGRVVGQALWEFYHGKMVNGATISNTWYPSTDRDFNVLAYWAADLQAASTYKDRYEYANRYMEILDKYSNWSSSGKADYCDIFDHHQVDNFINPAYCN